MQLQSLFDSYYLAQITDFPTRVGPNSASLVNNFFLDRNDYNKFQVHLVLNGLSDHIGQIVVLDNLQVMWQVDCTRSSREINEENTAYFQWALKNKNWEELYNHENVNMKFNIFHNIFLVIFENSFPLA
jgi:hypothetical protein